MYRVLLLALHLTAAASHECTRTGSGDNIKNLTRCENQLTYCDSESETDCDLNRRLGKWDCMKRCGKCITTVRTGTMIKPRPRDAHQLQVICGVKAYCGPETKISTYVLSMYVKKPENPAKNTTWADEDCIAHVGSEIDGSICDKHPPISTKYQDDWKIVEDNQRRTIQDARLILTLRNPSADVGTVFRCELVIRHPADRITSHYERYEEQLQLSQVPTTSAPKTSKPSQGPGGGPAPIPSEGPGGGPAPIPSQGPGGTPAPIPTKGPGETAVTTREPRTTTAQMPITTIVIVNIVGWSALSLCVAWIWYSRCYSKEPRPRTRKWKSGRRSTKSNSRRSSRTKPKRRQPSSEYTESTESTTSSER